MNLDSGIHSFSIHHLKRRNGRITCHNQAFKMFHFPTQKTHNNVPIYQVDKSVFDCCSQVFFLQHVRGEAATSLIQWMHHQNSPTVYYVLLNSPSYIFIQNVVRSFLQQTGRKPPTHRNAFILRLCAFSHPHLTNAEGNLNTDLYINNKSAMQSLNASFCFNSVSTDFACNVKIVFPRIQAST